MTGYRVLNHSISTAELSITITSWLLAVGILTLPRSVAQATVSSDGWISILLAGCLASLFSLLALKLALLFPSKTFYEITTQIISKPAAAVITLMMGLHVLSIAAFITRSLTDTSRHYLLERTPVEWSSFVFVLLLIYAVAGSRIGIIRLNVLFLPIVLIILSFVLFINGPDFQKSHILPMFESSWKQLGSGTLVSAYSVIASDVILFYSCLLRTSKKTNRSVLIGMSIPISLYTLIFIMSVGVMSKEATEQIIYPTIELAKRVEFPGLMFERFELLFFTTWIMTIFNSAVMAIDMSVWSFQMVFPRFNKAITAASLAALMYIAATIPEHIVERETVGQWIGYDSIAFAVVLPTILLIIAKVRKIGGKTTEQREVLS